MCPDEGQGGGEIRVQRGGGRALAPMGAVTLPMLLMIAAGERAESLLARAGSRSATANDRAFQKVVVSVRIDASFEFVTVSSTATAGALHQLAVMLNSLGLPHYGFLTSFPSFSYLIEPGCWSSQFL